MKKIINWINKKHEINGAIANTILFFIFVIGAIFIEYTIHSFSKDDNKLKIETSVIKIDSTNVYWYEYDITGDEVRHYYKPKK